MSIRRREGLGANLDLRVANPSAGSAFLRRRVWRRPGGTKRRRSSRPGTLLRRPRLRRPMVRITCFAEWPHLRRFVIQSNCRRWPPPIAGSATPVAPTDGSFDVTPAPRALLFQPRNSKSGTHRFASRTACTGVRATGTSLVMAEFHWRDERGGSGADKFTFGQT